MSPDPQYIAEKQQQDRPSDMATKLKDIPHKKISITCALCKHMVIHEVANLMLVVDENMTTHELRLRATCPKCKTVGDNSYSVG
jgi:hypothetical protein